MQNNLCDVTKCLTTVAAGVLSGQDRKKKLETGLLFEVLLLDWQIYFGVRLFFVTQCPHVPVVACQKAQTRKHVQMEPLSAWRYAVGQTTSLWSWWERGMQKRQHCMWGTVFPPAPSEGRTAQGIDCEDSSEKYPHLHQTPVSVVPTSMEGNVKLLFPFLQNLCGLSLRKKSGRVTSARLQDSLTNKTWRLMRTSAGKLTASKSSVADIMMRRKIPSLAKAMFKTTSRRWEIEPGSLKQTVWLSSCDNLMEEREKFVELNTSWVLLVRTWAIWKKN